MAENSEDEAGNSGLASTASADRFGRLEDVQLRSAWAHEALEFTPWLAENLDRLADVLGLELELAGQEVAVEKFSADILARSVRDGTMVLIENQFEQSDHTHLGQIMTYLAGLQASTVVWIAPKFKEPHLSAIRWLNEHTEEPFAFFAVELRVVRIGDSPMVPLFDVIERPNDWERSIQNVAAAKKAGGEVGQFRRDFWRHYEERLALPESDYAAPARWRFLREQAAKISLFVAPDRVGVFVGPEFGGDAQGLLMRLEGAAESLEQSLVAPINRQKPKELFLKRFMVDLSDKTNWDSAVDWLKAEADRYEAALIDVLGGKG